MVFYLTVSEVLAKSPEDLTDTHKVGGMVTAGSVQWDPKTLELSFKLKDQQADLIVNYAGVVPDSFKPGTEVIVEGIYQGDGKFLATAIMPKCASKYE
jgi:cytochrome c-type biogenesis protein CcmE